MRRMVLVLLAAALVLAGCARFRPTPPPDVPKKAPVSVWKRTVALQYPPAMAISPDFRAQRDVPGSGPAVVGTERFTVTWFLTAEIAATVGSNGPQPAAKTQSEKMVQATFDTGQPGTFEVWLEAVEYSRLVVVRKAEPTVKVGRVAPDGTVVPIADDMLLESGPLTLDFAFDYPMEPDTLTRLIQQVQSDLHNKQGIQGRTEWLSPDHARWEISQPPLELKLQPGFVLSKDGLPLRGARNLTLLHPGPKPYVERINVVDGRREHLAELAPDVMEAALSSDGGTLVTRAYEKRDDGQGNDWPTLVQMADLKTGKLTRVNIDPFSLTWTPNGDLLSFGTGLWGQENGWARWHVASAKVTHHTEGRFSHSPPAVSPDGKTAAFLRAPVDPGSQAATTAMDKSYPVSLVLMNLETQQELEIPEFVRTWYFGKEGDFRTWVAWSADGRKVLAVDPVERSQQSAVVEYELMSGQKRVVLDKLSTSPFGSRLKLSPDGTRLLVGHQVISLPGGAPVTLPGWSMQAHWDATGRRILSSVSDWDEDVYIYDLESGEQTNFGLGLPVGWHGDWIYIIRWEGSRLRHVSDL